MSLEQELLNRFFKLNERLDKRYTAKQAADKLKLRLNFSGDVERTDRVQRFSQAEQKLQIMLKQQGGKIFKRSDNLYSVDYIAFHLNLEPGEVAVFLADKPYFKQTSGGDYLLKPNG